MRIGAMTRRVTIQSVTRTPDVYGGWSEATIDVATVWAKVEPLQGNEQLVAMQIGMVMPYQFTIHYRAGITGITRLFYDGRTFDVKSVVDPDERHRELEILADEIDLVRFYGSGASALGGFKVAAA